MKEFLYYKIKAFKLWSALFLTRLKRFFAGKSISGKDFYNIPIIINNRNRYTFLKELVEWLEKNGYKNIYVLDNDSTYPPLLAYYKTFNHKVIFLKKNVGFKALWLTRVFKQFENSYYVYTDPDVLPLNDCPQNILEQLYNVLQKYKNIEKAGVALKIDDIPGHYANKTEVLRIENEFWKKEVGQNIYDAPVDTTFALYRPFAKGDAEECRAYRVAGKLIFRHQPWYENSNAPSEEETYYKNSVTKASSYWLNFK